MTFDEATEEAERMLFGNLPRFGEPGWRLYTVRERQKLKLMTYTIWSEATGKSPFTRPDLRSRNET